MSLQLGAAALERIRLAVGAGTVAEVRELPGGTHATTHLVRLVRPSVEVVVQQYPPGDDAGTRSADVLAALDGLSGRAPQLIAADVDGAWSDGSTVVMTAMPGDSSLAEADGLVRSAQLGVTLAMTHALDVTKLSHFDRVLDRSGGSLVSVSGPARTAVEAAWPRLVAQPVVLTHYDFWAGNTLWKGDEIVGIIDWSGAGLGPRGFDVSWSRLDAHLLWGTQAADAVLAAYENTGGEAVRDRRAWDLLAAGHAHRDIESWAENYGALGRRDVTSTVLRSKLTAWTDALIAE